MSSVEVDAGQMPMVHTEDIVSLISDSGVTRYRVNAKEWNIYQTDTGSYWYFPAGVYLEQFDTLLNVQGSLKADTAYNYESSALWRAVGNVYICNLQGLIFETSELFWDTKPASPDYAIYTDKFVRVTMPEGRVLTGWGMHSDVEMNNYVFYEVGVEIEVQEEAPQDTIVVAEDSLMMDSIIVSPHTEKAEINKTEENKENDE